MRSRSPRLSVRRSATLLGALLLLAARPSNEPGLPGYSAEGSRRELEWEGRMRALPDADTLRETMRRLSARPHHVGSAYDKDNAEWIRARLEAWGWDAKIERFDVLFPTPKERLLELVGPGRFRARLAEPPVAVDPTSSQQAEQLPTYNAYSIDGDVTAPLVFVNYGIPADYEQLERLGVSVKGAIVIAKYGRSWRGIKPKVAAEHGAVGCIIYSDPADDGYHAGEVFPEGPYRPADGVQRGSVMDMPLHPGDPLTPGAGATPGTARLSRDAARTLTRIPVLPISYRDAQPLLTAISGRVAPADWAGGLPITYHVGPGAAKVHLKLAFNWDTKPVYNVIATLKGSAAPDEWIVRGNHHDGWVNGAEDPISGQIALLEEARALGQLTRQGWRPRRTIVYAAWDGEEEGLLGSTEWAEAHAAELEQKAAVYINTDGNGRGYLGMGGSHTFEQFINDVARDIPDPETGLTAWKRAQLATIRNGSADDRVRARASLLRIEPLGSGSDFTPFLQHLGVASLNLGYGGEDDGGIYHSIYDDFYWYTHFSDTSFAYGKALAQTVGTAVMRLAGAEVLPLHFTGLAQNVAAYSTELQKLLDDRRTEFEERNRQLEEGVFAATSDPRRPTLAPPREVIPPHLNWAPLQNAIDSLTRSAARYDSVAAAVVAAGGQGFAAAADAGLNARLIASERRLTNPEGLPGRPWYRHLIYAPGFYTGYGVKTMPGVREAIEQKDYALADKEIARLAAVLMDEAALAGEAAGLLEQAAK